MLALLQEQEWAPSAAAIPCKLLVDCVLDCCVCWIWMGKERGAYDAAGKGEEH